MRKWMVLMVGCLWGLPVGADWAPVDDLSTDSPALAAKKREQSPMPAQGNGTMVLSAKLRALVAMDLPSQVAQLQAQVSELRGQLEEAEHQVALLKHQQSLAMQSGSRSGVKTPPQRAPFSTPAASEADRYQAALRQLQAREYDAALSGFKHYLETYPQGKYRANAYYWQGEVHLVRDEYAKALAAFDRVVQQFPLSSKLPDAMLKKAMALQAMGNAQGAKALYQSLVAKFPDSAAAHLAHEQQEQMSRMA